MPQVLPSLRSRGRGLAYQYFSGRLLGVNHKRGSPSRLLFLDTEALITPAQAGERHTYRLGWTRYVELKGDLCLKKDVWAPWGDPLELCRYIQSLCASSKPLHIIAHNIFYDLQLSLFFYHLPRWGWRLKFIYDEGLTYVLVIAKEGCTIKCVSTTNYFDCSLADLGKDVGMAKIEVDFRGAGEIQLSEHCRRDVEIVSLAFLKYLDFCKAHDAGSYRLTRASQAMASFRHRFMEDKIRLHRETSVKELERLSYFGGRVEAFRFGFCQGGPFVFADVNSMYPNVMAKNYFPTELVGETESVSLQELYEALETQSVVADVTLSTPAPVYPIRSNGKVMFPVGSFRTQLCTGSLSYALRHGHLREVHHAAFYDRAPIFASYVNYWYPLKARYKREGNELYTRLVKLFLNSLYGKFGQRCYLEEREDLEGLPDTVRMECHDVLTGESWIEYALFNVLVRQYGKRDTPSTFTAVAAHVTDYARLRLWELMLLAGLDKVLYCDTDSLALEERHLGPLQFAFHPTRLGSLSVAKRTDFLSIYGCKDYRTDSGRTVKGVPPRAVQTGEHTYRYLSFARSATLQAAEDVRGVDVRELTKEVLPGYDKGQILPDGRIIPWVLAL